MHGHTNVKKKHHDYSRETEAMSFNVPVRALEVTI